MSVSSSGLRSLVADEESAFSESGDAVDPWEKEFLRTGFRYALALTNHHQDAEDLVQQGCLRLYRKYGGVDQLPLLITTIRNLFLDECQRQARVRTVPLDDLDESQVECEAGDAGPAVARVEMGRLLARLRVDEREVLFFHYVQGYTAAQIGHLTGQPRGTVLSLLHRTRKKLGTIVGSKPSKSTDE